jgi:hypothetical protein
VRGRIIRAIIETEPQSPPLYREERVNLGFYANDVPELLAHEVENAASLLVRTLAAISDEQLTRTLHYGYPDASIRTVLWTFAQALHEFEHHGDDIVENEERLGR